MTMPDINDLSQRDLLVKLVVQLNDLKTNTDDKFDRLEESISVLIDVQTELARLDERVKENTKLRNWVYGSVITGMISAAMALMALNK